jgi:hypothetical protein
VKRLLAAVLALLAAPALGQGCSSSTCTNNSDCGSGEACLYWMGSCSAQGTCMTYPDNGSKGCGAPAAACGSEETLCGCGATVVSGCGYPGGYASGPTNGDRDCPGVGDGGPRRGGGDASPEAGEAGLGDRTDDDFTEPGYDSTTGRACTSDADCHATGGFGINACSNDVLYTGSLGDFALFPTPICIVPGTCDPLANGTNQITFCGGDPTNPASPGICYPTTVPPMAGKGTCFPQCQYEPDGTAAVGCQGKDVCHAYGTGTDSNGNLVGIGFCYGGCVTDADCASAGSNASNAADRVQKCDVPYGICVTTVTPPTLAIGAGCDLSSTTACNCITNPGGGTSGYCSTFCREGAGGCPGGWVCDLSLPTTVTSSTDATLAGWTENNPGMGGFCAPSCNLDSGTADTDGGTCPPSSTCEASHVGGPDCLPVP